MGKQKTETPPKPTADERRNMLLEGQEEVQEPVADAPEPEEQPEEQVEEPVAEPEAESQSEPQAEEKTEPSFLDRVRELGYEGEDPDEAAAALLGDYQRMTQEFRSVQQRMREQEELAQAGQEYLRIQREQRAKEQQAQEPEPAGPDPWWNPPKFDTTWIEKWRDVTLDENNQPVVGWKQNTPREVREAAEQYQAYLENWATDLVQRPQEVLPKVIEQEFNRLFEERINQREQSREFEELAEQIRTQNANWMYTQDTRGNPTLTPEGQMMTEILAEIGDAGVTDPRMQWELAVARFDYINRQRAAQQEQAAAQPETTADQKRKQHLKRGAVSSGLQNRRGTVAAPEEVSQRSQNPNLTPGQQLLQQLRQDGAEFV